MTSKYLESERLTHVALFRSHELAGDGGPNGHRQIRVDYVGPVIPLETEIVLLGERAAEAVRHVGLEGWARYWAVAGPAGSSADKMVVARVTWLRVAEVPDSDRFHHIAAELDGTDGQNFDFSSPSSERMSVAAALDAAAPADVSPDDVSCTPAEAKQLTALLEKAGDPDSAWINAARLAVEGRFRLEHSVAEPGGGLEAPWGRWPRRSRRRR